MVLLKMFPECGALEDECKEALSIISKVFAIETFLIVTTVIVAPAWIAFVDGLDRALEAAEESVVRYFAQRRRR